jgi:hypothetical protein
MIRLIFDSSSVSKKSLQTIAVAKEYELSPVFIDPKADVILRSSDNVDFQVYQAILSKASPVFEHMFQSPKPATMDDTELKGDVQIVPMEETASIVGHMLQLCYPIDDPVIRPLHQLRPVLGALVKYEMDGSRRAWIKEALTLAMDKEPLGVYATALSLGRISCHYQMVDEVRLAARITLRHVIIGGPLVPELALINGLDYHRLLEYHNHCRTKLKQITGRDEFQNFPYLKDPCPERRSSSCSRITKEIAGVSSITSRVWLVCWEKIMVQLDERPWGEAVKDKQIWIDTVRGVMDTSPCCAKSFLEHYPSFVDKLSQIIEETISEVSNHAGYHQTI